MTIEEIKELIQIVKDSGVAELEVQRGENRVWVKRAVAVAQEVVIPAAAPAVLAQMQVASAGAPIAGSPAPVPASAISGEQPIDVTSDPSLIFVQSPIVGTFYESPAPGAAPFVHAGDIVQPGKVLCIIESMKLMNEIESEVSGTIVAKLVDNGKPVEYGEKLFAVRPA